MSFTITAGRTTSGLICAIASFARKLLGQLAASRLRGIEVNKHMAIFWSPEDPSAGLVGEPIDGIYGYDPATATRIMEDIILFATAGPRAEPAAVPPPTNR